MKIKKMSGLWLGSISLMLGLLMLLQIPVSAVSASAATDLRYGRGISSDRTLTASDMYKLLYGDDLSDTEEKALDALAEVSMTYSLVPDSVVRSECDGDTGILTVLVNKYEYTAQNGQPVSWVPTLVRLKDGKSGERSEAPKDDDGDGVYSCSFDGMTQSQEFTLDVDFAWQVEIESEIADKLLTLPYDEAVKADEALSKYEQYQTELEAYNAWYNYPDKKDAYDKYLAAKEAYDRENDPYQEYLVALEKYRVDLEKYNENKQKADAYAKKLAEYKAYDEYRMEHAAFYAEYEAYLRDYRKIENALKILDSMFFDVIVSDGKWWGFYMTIKGHTATELLDTFEGLESATGISKDMILEGKAAGATLKALLAEYKGIREATYHSEFERVAAKFAFYKMHYDELCENLEILYKSMYEIYTTGGVSSALNKLGKTYRAQMMVAHLYVLYAALDDDLTMDPNWVLKYSDKGQKTLNEILHEKHRLTDPDDVNPRGLTMPEKEMVLPEGQMEPVDPPGEPDYDEELSQQNPPNPPDPVDEPKLPCPEKVENPGDTRPEKVDNPKVVANPKLSAIQLALVNEYREGKLTKKTSDGRNKVLTLTQTVSSKRSFRVVNMVTFYGFDGEKIGEIVVDRGNLLNLYKEYYPNWEKQADERYSSYRFLGWVWYGVSNPTQSDYLDLDSIRVTEDLAIVAHYDAEERKYEVTWDINGKKEKEYYGYGKMPKCPLEYEVLYDGAISYEFQGWEDASGQTVSDFEPVTKNITYKAVYKENRPTYKVTWIIGNHEIVTWVPYGYPATPPEDISPDDYFYTFRGWDAPLSNFVKGELTYRSTDYNRIPLAKQQDGSVCPAEHTSGKIILRPSQPVLQISDALTYALRVGKQLEIVWDGFSVTFTAEQVKVLKDGGCFRIAVKEEIRAEDGAVYYQLEFKNQRYSYDPQLSLNVAICRPSFKNTEGIVYLANGASEREIESKSYTSKLVFEMQSCDRVLYRPRYFLQVSDPSRNSDYTSVQSKAAAGEIINLAVNCGYGYEVVGAVLTYPDGRREEVGVQFVMPADPISVELKVERIVFHIIFEVEGQIYQEMDLFFDDLIELPEKPVKASDDTYTYSFDGWSPQVWTRAVYRDQRNPVFKAVFSAHEIRTLAVDNYRDTLLIRLIVIGLAGIGLIVGLILCVIHRKRVGAFVRRVIKGFVPFVRRCFSQIKGKVASVWNKIAKRKKQP